MPRAVRWESWGLAARANGHDAFVDTSDRLWVEAHAAVQSSVDADLREEAYEVFVAEAARCRLVDRCGPVTLTLRCGAVVRGDVVVELVDRHLAVKVDDGATLLVPVEMVVLMTGGAPALRREGQVEATINSRLRQAWSEGNTIRVLLADGGWRQGEIDFVGADHVTLRCVDTLITVPTHNVEAWQLR